MDDRDSSSDFEHIDDVPAQTASQSSGSATSNITLSSLETDFKNCGVNESFMLVNDVSRGVRPLVELSGVPDTKINSKLGFSYNGRIYGKIGITGKKPVHILKEDNSWRAFKSELKFIATNLCHWHSHPSIIRYHGLAILLEEAGGCVPYLLSERVEWNLLSLLEDKDTKLTQREKVSIIHDIASGLNFLHSHRPRTIVHAALDSSSVLIDEGRNAKLTNFFHAGYEGDSFTVVSESHKPSNCNAEMKLETSLDMTSLGYIIKAIDTEHKNRERVRGSRNVLEDFYVLYDSEGGPPQDLSSCEVSRKLGDYLDKGQQVSRMRRVARFIEDKFVSMFAPEGEDQDVADDFDRDMFGRSIVVRKH